MSAPAGTLNATKLVAYVGGKYSLHRCVTNKQDGTMMPIISFRTQQWPVVQVGRS